jgi:glutamine amidotransferase
VTRPVIAVLDYGIGNLHSAQKALEHVGADARLTADAELIAAADGVVLPGVGAFGACMEALRATRLDGPARAAAGSGRPFLGICVGMQMLFTKSEEDPDVAGLDLIPGTVTWIPAGPKIPQMQWNRLDVVADADPMLAGLGDEAYLYFVHSLHGVPDDATTVVATVEYGTTLNAAFRLDNVFAVQFHPEKSSRPGLRLLRNFVEECVAQAPGADVDDG